MRLKQISLDTVKQYHPQLRNHQLAVSAARNRQSLTSRSESMLILCSQESTAQDQDHDPELPAKHRNNRCHVEIIGYSQVVNGQRQLERRQLDKHHRVPRCDGSAKIFGNEV
jgi:hypothetical protein